jgi:O-antigen ligase
LFSLRDLLIGTLGPVWSVFPEAGSDFLTFNTPFTAAIAVGFWLRIEKRALRNTNYCVTHVNSKWIQGARVSLWAIVMSYVLSCIMISINLLDPPGGWMVVSGSWSNLKALNSYSTFSPVWATINALSSLLLGLLLISYVSVARLDAKNKMYDGLEQMPVNPVVVVCSLTGFLLSLHVITQLMTGYQWPFINDVQPSGPFENRNLLSPLLVIFGAICFSVEFKTEVYKFPFFLLGCLLLLLAMLTCSRNGLLLATLTLLIFLSIRATRKRLIYSVIILVPFLAVSTVVWEGLSSHCLINTIDRMKKTFETTSVHQETPLASDEAESSSSEWKEPRPRIYATAIRIWAEHPLAGAGPMSFVMLTHMNARYGSVSDELGESLVHAHNIPLHLLAEIGIFGSVAWIALWCLGPLIVFFKSRAGILAALPVLLIGIGSQFDYLWRAPGMNTFSVIILIGD